MITRINSNVTDGLDSHDESICFVDIRLSQKIRNSLAQVPHSSPIRQY